MSSTGFLGIDLLEAASKGNIDEIKRLLAEGADINYRDISNGATCLHCHFAATRLLLELGADPNIVTQNTSASPLGVAALHGNREMVDLLLAFNARLSENEVATALLPECRELGFNDIADRIEAAG